MRATPLTLASALFLGSALGCSETPPPVLPTPAPPPTVATQVTPPTDLTPVPEPTDIFVSARWKNPDATLSGLSSCAGVPGTLAETNARTLVDKALANAFRGGADGRKLAELVAFDAPVDLIVSLGEGKRFPPQPLFAFSIGLTSIERARAALSELVELAPGLYRVGAPDAGDLSCALGPAAGSAPARLICGRHDKDVIALGPYLARNLPVAAPPAHDVHAELHFTPVDQRYGADLRRGLGFLPNLARTQTIGDPRYDRALEEAAAAIADEGAALAGDLDRVTLDLGVDASSCLEARSSLQLRGKSSWLAGTLAESGQRSGPAPAIFWHAPVDSDSASYGRATDVTRYNGIFRTLRGLVEGKLAKEKVGSEADRKALAALIALPLGKDTNVVVASGHVHVASKAPADAKLTEQQLTDKFINSYFGWYLLGFDEGPEALTRLIKDVTSVYGRKGFADPVRKALGEDASALPAAKLVTAPKELGKGALDLELKFEIPSRRGEKKPIGFAVHLLLMPDGKSTWVAVGANRDALVKHLQMARAGAPDTATLASRQGLEPLRTGKAISSGFITLAMFTRGISSVLGNPGFTADSTRRPLLAEIANTLNNLPHRGETPMFVTSEAALRDGTAPRGEVTLQVQKGSFEDLGVMVLTGLRLAGNAGLLPPGKP